MLRPFTSVKLSLRLPPTKDAPAGADELKAVLEKDPPYGAQVSFHVDGKESGWNAPALAPWLKQAVSDASMATFGRPVAMMGEGGSIPFMGMLGKKFPKAQFVITGVLGPALQRPRPERIPAHPHRQAGDRGRGPHRGRPFHPRGLRRRLRLIRQGLTASWTQPAR